MVKEATNPEHTFEYAGAEEQTVEKSDFVIFLLLSSFSYKTLD